VSISRLENSPRVFEIHGIVVWRRGRSRPIVRRLVARILAFVTIVKRAIEAELAARRAAAELADRATRRWAAIGAFVALVSAGVAVADDLTGQASIIDGDTLEIHGTRIRLWGIWSVLAAGMSVGRMGSSRAGAISMLMTKERRLAIRTLRGWAISVLQEAGAIRKCEEHGWMQDRADPHARDRAFDIARRDPPPGMSPKEAVAAVEDVLGSIGDTCPECLPED
jgi:hypothetical protein